MESCSIHTLQKPPRSVDNLVVTGSQWGETSWPCRVKLMTNIKFCVTQICDGKT